MKLSPRETLLKEADSELNNIRTKIKERKINSQSDWDKFAKDEKLAEINTEKWLDQVKELSKKGKMDIDLKYLNPKDKIRARTLIRQLDIEINKLETGNPYGFGEVYSLLQIISALLGIFAIGAGIVTAFFEDITQPNSGLQNEKSFELLKKFKNPPTVKKHTPKQILNWIKSVVSVIKK